MTWEENVNKENYFATCPTLQKEHSQVYMATFFFFFWQVNFLNHQFYNKITKMLLLFS